VTALLVLVHAGLVVPWLGGMVYRLTVVQPRAERLLETTRTRLSAPETDNVGSSNARR